MRDKHRDHHGGITGALERLGFMALAIAAASHAQANRYDLGNVTVTVDSQISVGASWRTEDRNPDYIARGTLAAMGDSSDPNPSYQGHSSSNTDDGNMNFDKGDAFSQVIKGNHSLRFVPNAASHVGLNLSFRYWYDYVLANQDGSSRSADMVDDWKRKAAYDEAKSGIELMDGYLWTDFSVAGRPAQLVLGRQVLNWGESSFIQGGQNVANPVDVPALRRPGAEIRDALLPVNMLSGSIALDEIGSLSLLGYYQLEWRRTRADACGTVFSNNDFAAEGCKPVYYQSNISEQANRDGVLTGTPFQSLAGAFAVLQPFLAPDSTSLTIAGRLPDNEPSIGDQYGIALKWYVEALNGTEFGLSYQNIHGRLPVVGGMLSAGSDAQLAAIFAGAYQQYLATNAVDAQNPTPTEQNDAATFAVGTTVTAAGAGAGSDADTRYRIDFPEDQKIFALSFASQLPTGTAWSGELTYRPDAPVQINANDILVRGLLGNLGYDPDLHNNDAHPLYGALLVRLPAEIRQLKAGEQQGYRELDIYQFQTTFLHDINRVLGAENFRVLAELGFTYVNDLPDTDQMRFGRSSVYGSWGAYQADFNGTNPDASKIFADNGYVTSLSWGYRLLAQLSYPNAFMGMTLKPTLFWSHDVKGYGPEPGSQFYEGRKIVGTTLGLEYLNSFFANLSYNHYYQTDYWDLDDRNHVSLSVGMNF